MMKTLELLWHEEGKSQFSVTMMTTKEMDLVEERMEYSGIIHSHKVVHSPPAKLLLWSINFAEKEKHTVKN